MTQIFDRIKETCTVIGTGDITLTGAENASFDAYSSRYSDGDEVPYIVVEALTAFEAGTGIITSGVIARTAGGVTSSSNSDGLVVFTGGNKDCFASLTHADLLDLEARVRDVSADIALLHFYRAIDNGLSVQLMLDGFVDEFEDTTGVDTLTSIATHDPVLSSYERLLDINNTTLAPEHLGSFSVLSEVAVANDLYFKPDGLKVYVVGSTETVAQYTLAVAWVVSSGVTLDGTYTTNPPAFNGVGVGFSSDGLTLYVGESTNIHRYSVSVAWDITSTVVFLDTLTGLPVFVAFVLGDSDNKLYLGRAGAIEQYTTTSPSNLTLGVSLDTSFAVTSAEISMKGLAISSLGDKIYMVGNSFQSIVLITLQTAWDLTASPIIASQHPIASFETFPTGVAISADGTKVFLLGIQTDRVRGFSLPAPYILNVEKKGSLAITSGQDIAFKPDGTKLYVLYFDSIVQISLTVPWSLTGGNSIDTTFTLTPKVNLGEGLNFSPDGLSFIVVSAGTNEVLLYKLGTAWDLAATVTFAALLLISAQGNTFRCARFSDSGNKLLISESTGAVINQYSLPSPYDFRLWIVTEVTVNTFSRGVFISAAGDKAYILSSTGIISQYSLTDSNSFAGGFVLDGTLDISGKQTSAQDIFISSDGLNLFVIGQTDDTINKYRLSVAWDVTNTVEVLDELDISAQGTLFTGVLFSPDGTKVFGLDAGGNDINQWTLDTPWRIGNIDRGSLTPVGISRSMVFKPDGLKLYVADAGADNINQHTLTTPWDITQGVSLDGATSVTSEQTLPVAIAFKSDGTKMYVVGLTPSKVSQYTLTVAWDVTSGKTLDGEYDLSPFGATPRQLIFKSDGLTAFTADDANNNIRQFDLTTAWDFTGTVASTNSFSVSAQTTLVRGMHIDSAGLSLLVVSNVAEIYRYSLAVAWDLSSTVTFEASLNLGLVVSSPEGMILGDTNQKLYLGNASKITQIDLLVAGEPDATPLLDGTVSISSEQTGPSGMYIDPTGLKLIVAGQAPLGLTRYDIASAWDLTSGLSLQSEILTQGTALASDGMTMTADGLSLFLCKGTDLGEYKMLSSFDVGLTPTFQGGTSVASEIALPDGITLNDLEDRLFVCNGAEVEQYDLTSAGTVLTGLVSKGQLTLTALVDTSLRGLSLRPDGSSLYTIDNQNVSHFDLTTPLQPLELISQNYTALETPEEGSLVILAQGPSAAQITASISRNAGTTYSIVTLTKQGVSNLGSDIFTGFVDLTPQPAGVSMSYKIESNVVLTIQGVSLQWR